MVSITTNAQGAAPNANQTAAPSLETPKGSMELYHNSDNSCSMKNTYEVALFIAQQALEGKSLEGFRNHMERELADRPIFQNKACKLIDNVAEVIKELGAAELCNALTILIAKESN